MEVGQHRSVNFILFLLLACGQVWMLYGLGKWLGIAFSMNPRHPGGLLFLYGAAVPTLSAVISTLITEKKTGLVRLLKKSLCRRPSFALCLAACLIPFVVEGINAMAIVAGGGPGLPQNGFRPIFGTGFLVFFLVHNGLGEEIGWRGLALDVLQHRLGSLGGNASLGIVWALWHLPLFFMKGSFQHGDSLVLYIYLLTCWSIVIGMLVNKCRGSIWPAILFHETANFIAFTIHLSGGLATLLAWGAAAAMAAAFLPRPYFRAPWRSPGKT